MHGPRLVGCVGMVKVIIVRLGPIVEDLYEVLQAISSVLDYLPFSVDFLSALDYCLCP